MSTETTWQTFATSFKKSLSSLILYNFFHYFTHVYSPGTGADNTFGTKFWCNRNILSLRLFVASFKKNLFWVWFIHFFFMILYMYIAPGQGLTTPCGWNFNVNRNILSLQLFVASLKKKISLKSDFIYFFHDFIHVYSPGAGADIPQGTKFWFQQKCLVTPFICCKFQKEMSL